MSKHTPGPWQVNGFAQDDIYPGIMQVVTDSDGKVIRAKQVMPFYNCDPSTDEHARHMADKALIAAAPELLQACVTFLQQLGNGELQVYPSDEDGSPDVCELIEAAVTKAGVRVNYQ